MKPELAARACPVCGNSELSRVFAESNVDWDRLGAFAFALRKLPEHMHHRLLSCAGCDVLYSSPVPTESNLLAAYVAADFDSGNEAALASLTYMRLLSKFEKPLPDRQGTLDVGTGDGAFLERLVDARFTGILGVEPSAAPVAAANPRVRPLIIAGAFRGSDYTPASLSLVTCFQTIEHVSDPLALCREAFSLLKPGGMLMLVCHNHRALSAKLMGRKSPIFDVEHLQLFSMRSIRTLLSEAGFSNTVVKPVINSYPLAYWLRLSPLSIGLKRWLIPAANFLLVGKICLPVPAGNLVAVGYKPR